MFDGFGLLRVELEAPELVASELPAFLGARRA
jgi:hypothetical protein